MRSFSNRNSNYQWLYSFPALIVILLAIVFMGRSAFRAYSESRNVQMAYFEIKRERGEIEVQKADLEKRLDYLSTPYGLEKELRRQFGLVKPGEELVTIINNSEQEVSVEDGGLRSFFRNIKEFFTNIF